MNYTSVITSLEKAPDGWLEMLTLQQYQQYRVHNPVRLRYYEAVYKKYRTKKIRSYDDTGRFEGWRPIRIGLGEPISYKYIGYIAAHVIDRINDSNIIMRRLLASERSF